MSYYPFPRQLIKGLFLWIPWRNIKKQKYFILNCGKMRCGGYLVFIIVSLTLIASSSPLPTPPVGIDAPTWNIGDSWTYNVYYHELSGNQSADWFLDHVKLTVINITREWYTLSIHGRVNGKLEMPGPSLDLNNGVLEGTAIMRRSDLAFYKSWIWINGSQTISFIEVPVEIRILITVEPPSTSMKFPLYVGSRWFTQESEIIVNLSVKVNGEPLSLPPETNITTSSVEMMCEAIESVEVEAGRYNSFRIIDADGFHQTFFSPEAGAIIKRVLHNETMNMYIELVDTNFKPTCIPSQPVGVTTGKPGVTHKYYTTAVSLTNIYYKWDWGDDSYSDWLGPYNSMEIHSAQHSWSKPGVYEVKVKALEENGVESPWSKPLVVCIYEDSTPPTIQLIRPMENSIYYGNTRICYSPIGTILLGDIDIEFKVWDNESGVNTTELYINDKLVEEFHEEQCIYHFDASPGRYSIEVVAIDKLGNQEKSGINLWKIF